MKLRLLMVDDDVTLTHVLGKCVERDGRWEFNSASNFSDGIERARSWRPDVIILDYDFGPGRQTGFDVLKALRLDPALAPIPVIVFTGTMIRSDNVVEGLDLGADSYLRKPVSPEVLLARARAAVARSQKADRMR
ncbi:MAG: response regulator [Elusimicrobia bacterium]|nr:response regulator [Elusimicrobiota bacterium]